MPFALNGNVLLNPTTHKWVIPQSYGTSGAGRVLYPGVLAYEMNWSALTPAEYNTLTNTYLSGTAVASLPEWRGTPLSPTPYEFENYSGTYLSMPEYQSFFEGQYQSVRLLINHVTV